MVREIEWVRFESIESTSKWAKGHAKEIDPNKLTVVTAKEQTAGHGQFGRGWVSPPGNLYASFCFGVPIGWPGVIELAKMLSFAAAEVLPIDVQFKHPNDLLVNGKKIAGALCELVTFDDYLLAIDGIGLNVNMPAEACAQIDQPATSLLVETGREHDVEVLLQQLVQSFNKAACKK